MSASTGPVTVAFLATGDELIQGDILNTNTQYMLQALDQADILPGQQVIARDEHDELLASLQFLLLYHRVVVTIGGLGPTHDDLTRFAVAECFSVDLEFNEDSWSRLSARLERRNIPLTKNNQQQCFFPRGAQIIVNPRGTADACYIEADGKLLIMLPGPPRECLPLFDEVVLPMLLARDLAVSRFHRRWLLMGVGEGQAAEKIQTLIADVDLHIGYRAAYPYLEVKFYAHEQARVARAGALFEATFSENIVSNVGVKASDGLCDYLTQHKLQVCIEDQVTQGLLRHGLVHPGMQSHIDFSVIQSSYDLHLKLTGLNGYWANSENLADELHIELLAPHQQHWKLPLRLLGRNTLEWVVEMVCWKVLQVLSS